MKFIYVCLTLSAGAGIFRGFLSAPLSPLGWILLIGVGGIMCSFECLNTAIETLCDRVVPRYDCEIRKIKHLLSAAGCFIGISCLIVGSLTLWFNP